MNLQPYQQTILKFLLTGEKINLHSRPRKMITTYPESLIKSACLDGDGSLYLFDQDGNPLDGWPENWPVYIENVKNFLATKQIFLSV